VGTTVLLAVIVNFFNATGYLLSGNVDLPTVILMLLGSLTGIKIGCRLTNKVPDRLLKGVMITVIGLATILMFAKVCRTTVPEPPSGPRPTPIISPAADD
jgi:uncharacterized membrane protein YfcA